MSRHNSGCGVIKFVAFRELLFTAPGIENHISGVILFEQTVGQATTDGKNFVELLRRSDALTKLFSVSFL